MPPTSGLIFTIEVDGKPTVAVEANRLQEATELCREDWFRADLSVRSSKGIPLCRPTSKLRARIATRSEHAAYQQAYATPSDDIGMVYLVEVDGPPLAVVTAICELAGPLLERIGDAKTGVSFTRIIGLIRQQSHLLDVALNPDQRCLFMVFHSWQVLMFEIKFQRLNVIKVEIDRAAMPPTLG